MGSRNSGNESHTYQTRAQSALRTRRRSNSTTCTTIMKNMKVFRRVKNLSTRGKRDGKREEAEKCLLDEKDVMEVTRSGSFAEFAAFDDNDAAELTLPPSLSLYTSRTPTTPRIISTDERNDSKPRKFGGRSRSKQVTDKARQSSTATSPRTPTKGTPRNEKSLPSNSPRLRRQDTPDANISASPEKRDDDGHSSASVSSSDDSHPSKRVTKKTILPPTVKHKEQQDEELMRRKLKKAELEAKSGLLLPPRVASRESDEESAASDKREQEFVKKQRYWRRRMKSSRHHQQPYVRKATKRRAKRTVTKVEQELDAPPIIQNSSSFSREEYVTRGLCQQGGIHCMYLIFLGVFGQSGEHLDDTPKTKMVMSTEGDDEDAVYVPNSSFVSRESRNDEFYLCSMDGRDSIPESPRDKRASGLHYLDDTIHEEPEEDVQYDQDRRRKSAGVDPASSEETGPRVNGEQRKRNRFGKKTIKMIGDRLGLGKQPAESIENVSSLSESDSEMDEDETLSADKHSKRDDVRSWELDQHDERSKFIEVVHAEC